MSEEANIAILILAAGSSSRMGQPKQLLKWGDSTLLNHSIEQAVTSEAKEVYVVLGSNYDKIKTSIINPSVIVFNNKEWNQGMGNTISFGVNQLKNQGFDGILLMLADQPQVDTEFLNKLITSFEKGEKPIISTSYKNKGGVPALFDKSYFEPLGFLAGKKGAKALISRTLKNASLIMPSKPITDIDTMEAYQNFYDSIFNLA